MSRAKVAIAQVGGPTPVINATLFGFLQETVEYYDIYGIVGGLEGLAKDRMVHLTCANLPECARASRMPGAWLGSGRYRADASEYVNTLVARDIRALVLIGGNGTMYSALMIEREARDRNYELQVAGAPKTVDNDLAETDHAPGFGSAARFVASAVRDSGMDLSSMRNFENVRILETMGRNVGWLALASGYLKRCPQDPPHLIYVPENTPSPDMFLAGIEREYRAHGHVLAVVSEGVSPAAHDHLERPVLGGVAQEYARLVGGELGLAARGESLGMGQRSYSMAVSEQDRSEALAVGSEAARALHSGAAAGRMLSLERRTQGSGLAGYDYRIQPVPLQQVAGIERRLPAEWVDTSRGMPDGYRRWLAPLVGEDFEDYPIPMLDIHQESDTYSSSKEERT